MATMPAASTPGQPDAALAWFGTDAGQALLLNETDAIAALLEQGRGLPWLWLAPCLPACDQPPSEPLAPGLAGRGLRLAPAESGWMGGARCGLPLPLASESVGVVVLQHVLRRDGGDETLLAECVRILVPGGRLGLFALNPLAPYRWHWRGQGLRSAEPLGWRRRLRAAGLDPEPLSQGVGPTWRAASEAGLQQGVGLRAAYLLRAEKRVLPLTPVRPRRAPVLPDGVPAT